jgi:hypothetical protein
MALQAISDEANREGLIERIAELERINFDHYLSAGADKERIAELQEIISRIPQTPEQMIGFIGSHFGSMEAQGWTDELPANPTGDLSMVKYSLTVHDLLSAFSWADLDRCAIAAQSESKEGE